LVGCLGEVVPLFSRLIVLAMGKEVGCLLLQCLAQWVLLLLELEGWLLQRVRVAAVPVPIAAA